MPFHPTNAEHHGPPENGLIHLITVIYTGVQSLISFQLVFWFFFNILPPWLFDFFVVPYNNFAGDNSSLKFMIKFRKKNHIFLTSFYATF